MARPGQHRKLDPYTDTDNLERSRRVDLSSAPQAVASRAGLTVAVLNRDRPDLLLPLLDTLGEVAAAFRRKGLGFEVVVGDTGSTDQAVLRRYSQPEPWLTVVPDLDYHFSLCNNTCVEAASVRHDTVLLLNNDVVLPSPDPVVQMHALLQDDASAGVVGLRMLFPDGTIQHAGIDIVRSGFRRGLPWHPAAGFPGDAGTVARYPALAVTGACLMVRREVWDAVGGLDAGYRVECQDVDLCLAVRRMGYTVAVVDAGRVVHLEGATRGGGDESAPDRRLFLRRWSAFLEATYL